MNCQLLLITSNLDSTTFPLACLWTNRKTKDVYKRFFTSLKKVGLVVENGMKDMEFGLYDAGKETWPQSSWQLCYFHIVHSILEHCTQLHLADFHSTIHAIVDKMHSQSGDDALTCWEESEAKMDSVVPDEQKSKWKMIVAYFNHWYLPHVNEWCSPPSSIAATNNNIEHYNCY